MIQKNILTVWMVAFLLAETAFGIQNTIALSPTYTYSNPGVYSACLNCGNTPSQCVPCANITVPGNYNGSSEIIEINNKNDYIISPNPFFSQTNLQTKFFWNNATLTIDNCFGQTVKQIKNISGQTITLYRDNLPSGLYFLRLTQDNQVIATKKLIVTD